MFWIVFILAVTTTYLFDKNYSDIKNYQSYEHLIMVIFAFLAIPFVSKKKIKSFSKRKNVKWYKIYDSSNYKNRNLLQTFSEMREVYLNEIKKGNKKNKAIKKSLNILKRDLTEIFKIIIYVFFGVVIGGIILLAIFAIFIFIYNYSHSKQ